jgi:hypothetical protein
MPQGPIVFAITLTSKLMWWATIVSASPRALVNSAIEARPMPSRLGTLQAVMAGEKAPFGAAHFHAAVVIMVEGSTAYRREPASPSSTLERVSTSM